MSFQFNSDREQIRGVDSTIVGSNSVRIRAGGGSNEREIIQAVIDSGTNLPRVGINRTGRRVERIDVLSPGTGYTDTPTINFSNPTLPGGFKPVATADTDSSGRIISILIDNPGDGYEIAPTVTIEGGGGFGASAEAFLDTIDFELDINGAIRTSTSIISDTANILNLDIDNLVTPDIKVRAPHLKVFLNGVGVPFPDQAEPIQVNKYYFYNKNVYQSLNTGTCGILPPTHEDGTELNGDVLFKHIGYRVDAPNDKFYGEGGDSGIFPRSITPLLGDRSDKIATTEYVLNLATNDVGGRIYVSEQIGDNDNDGRSPVNPVRTIKKACQLAWETPGVKESIIIAGGEYLEDNPISIPPDASIVGDNLRLVIIRPDNPGKHIFKFGDKNYVIGVTYQDKVNSSGASVGTWDFAMVFDDKQRITYDIAANGDFGTNFPIGHQFFGPQKYKATFSFNTGGNSLVNGTIARGSTSGVLARINEVAFNITDTNDPNAFTTGNIANVVGISGTFQTSESFSYGGAGTLRWDGGIVYQLGDLVWNINSVYEVTTAGTSGTIGPTHTDSTPTTDDGGQVFYTYVRDAYEFNANNVTSTRAEGEVVFEGRDEAVQPIVELPIKIVDFTQQGTWTDGFNSEFYGNSEDLGGVVFYTNLLEGANNVHDFKEGEEIEIIGMPTDLNFLNGKQRIYKVLEDADGRARRFVIPKKIDPSLGYNTQSAWDPEAQGSVVSVRTFSKSVTLSLLNSPNKFPVSEPVARRYQDACLQIRNNIDFIADEVVGRVNDEFKKEYFAVYDTTTLNFKVYLGTSRFAHTYVSGGTVTFNGNTVNVTDFIYDHNVTGEATITVDSPHGASDDDTILLADLVVSCIIDGVVTEKTYPSFNIPVSDQKCRRDIGHFLNALIQDLEFGSNYNIINSALKYVDAGQIEYVDYEIIQTVRAIEYARELAIYAMRKWRTGNGLTDPVYSAQYTTLDAYIDPTVIDDTTGSPACANVASAINTLSYLFVDVLSNNASGTYLDAAYLIARNRDAIADEAYLVTKNQYPSLGLNDVDERKCRRDINYILSGVLRDLVLGGNTGSVNAAEFYFTGTTLTGVPASELGATRYAFTQVRDLSIAAMRNWVSSSGSAVTLTQSIIPQFTDSSILADPAGNPLCANVEASLTTSFGLIDGILEYAEDANSATAIQPGTTNRTTGTLYAGDDVISYPDNILRDAVGNTVTIRAVYDDLPIISASPYTQNSSIISKIGGSGALIDGSKVKSPNCPFAGLTDGRATFPNQGKSMVASAFTIVSEKNGIGYKVIEDGYTQLVSVFCIFTVDGILCESGGYASVTNSASNFGTFALRATGVRREPYEFDAGYRTSSGYNRAFIDVVSESVTGNTELTIDNIGRVPLEHYIVRIDGLESGEPEDEYFIDKVELLREGPPYRARVTITDGSGGGGAVFRDKTTGNVVANSTLATRLVALHRPSICNSSSHTWEFVGSGTDYNALPENGGVKVESNEQVSENYGRTYVSGTDELGDFKVGTFAKIENRTGNITFTGTVSISEVEFLKLRGGDVVVTGFDNSNTLGGSQSSDSKLPTQKAVRDYITNNLGQYINKNYSTNALPRALVELNDSGKISEAQLPPISPIEVYSVDTQAERLALEGVNAGDIVIEDGTPFILNTDNDSVFLGIVPDTTLQFTAFDVFTGSNTGGKIQLTEYRPGVIREITIDDPGSGYSTPPAIIINDSSLGTQLGHVPAAAEAQVVNGEIVAINIQNSNGLIGGKGYLDDATNKVTITFSGGGGSGAQASVFLESRLYGDIVNNIKPVANETIQSSDVPAETVNISRVVNTSGSNNSNWTSLSTSTVDASDIIGIIPTSKLAAEDEAANSNTALFGDQSYKKVVKSLRSTETRYFIKTADVSGSDTLLFNASDSNVGNLLIGHGIVNVNGVQTGTTISQIADITVGQTVYKRITLSDGLTSSVAAGTIIEFVRPASPVLLESLIPSADFVESVQIESGGTGFTNGTFNNVQITPTNAGPDAEGLQLKFVIENGTVTSCTVDNGGSGFENDFTLTDIPTETIGSGSGLILRVKINTEDKLHSDVAIDIARANNDTLSDEDFGNVGVVRFRKSQFDVGANGAVTLFTGIDSGLDADLLDGQQGSYYRNADNINAGILGTAYLSSSETYNISISQSSGETAKLTSKTGALLADDPPRNFVDGGSIDVRRNSTNGLLDPEFKEAIDQQTGETTLVSTANDYNTVLSIRGGGDDTSNPYGGVTQLGFTDANNVWIRGSSGSVSTTATFSAWAKLWSSGNDYTADPADSRSVAGPNAYRLRNRTGQWYQNASTLIYGSVLDNRMPTYQTRKDFNTRIRLLQDSGAGVRYSIYILRVNAAIVNTLENNTLFTQSPFVVKLLDAFGNDPGEISISNIRILNNDGTPVNTASSTIDYNQVYAIVTGTLIVGSFTGAVEIGDNTVQIPFDDYTISEYDGNADGMPDGNIEISRLESDNGTAKFFLGRADGVVNSQTTPTIYFRSSEDGGTGDFYTAAIQASGGTDALGSGTLNVLVTSPNEFKVGSNTVWNAGNVVFNTDGTASTTDAQGNITIKSAVFLDENGDFTASTITANLTGLASDNLPLAGGDLTGPLKIGDSNNDQSLTVYGPTSLFGTLGIEEDLTVDGGTLFVDASENKVAIGTTGFTADTSTKLLVDGSSALPGYITVTGGNSNIASGIRFLHQGGGTRTNTSGRWEMGFGSGETDFGAGQNSLGAKEGLYFSHTAGANTNVPLILNRDGDVVVPYKLGINTLDPSFTLQVEGDAKVQDAITIGSTANNNGAPIYFLGATGGLVGGTSSYLSNFRVGNQLGGADVFEITAGDHGNVNNEWKATPALAIQGTNNRVAINSSVFGGTDPEEVDENGDPIERVYTLNVGGDININGLVFQNNAEFVTSRWTEAPNETDIYRGTKVGINFQTAKNPDYDLEVDGTLGLSGAIYANDDPLWLDTYGIIKVNRGTLDEDVTITSGLNAVSNGPIVINSGTITVDSGATWVIT